MTEGTETVVPPTSVREFRHQAKSALSAAFALVEGREGFTKEQQIESLSLAAEQATTAATILAAAHEFAVQRDFAAHQAEKHAGMPAAEILNTGLSVVPDDEDEAEDDD